MLNGKDNYSDMIYAGALGFVLKTSGKKEFEKAINTIISGESYFSAELLRQMVLSSHKKETSDYDDIRTEKFSERELEVLQLLCKGFSVAEIADQIFLSSKTVETHRSTLLKKTKTRNTVNLILYAIKNKLVEI